MDFDLSRDVRLVRRSVREFAEQMVAPLVEEMEQRDEFPTTLARALGELGVLGLVTPPEYGGSNLGHLARTVAVEEVSRVSAAVGISLQVHHMATAALADFGSDAQKEKYLPALCRGDSLGTCAITEPTGGSRPPRDGQHRAPGGGRVSAHRAQVFHHQLPPERRRGHGGQDRRGAQGDQRVRDREGHPRVLPGRHEHKLGCAAPTPANWSSATTTCRART